ncbi:hypothetical protein CTAYLR_007362 [Chrysophaeum taylorii]|uniref:Uncharacterized protein n=1 Tax=Chrysophaeum taylorii TaxID=2483200 RepID=A0AAD7U4M4_9STRA|nr:hypothetical protein CTAYLR_007362 [Chrysophaeum taylorii]
MSSKRKQKALQRKEDAAQQPEVEYTPPDPSTKITWPRSLAGSVDDSRFIVVWPNNINSKKTIPEGRRVALEHACEVWDDPIVQEMSEVCQYLKLTHVIEPYKALPRDLLAYPGRIKVQLLDAQGEPVNPEAPTRKALMRRMGDLIPKLNIRKQRDAIKAKEKELQQMQLEAGTAGGNKKKGKKKGRR